MNQSEIIFQRSVCKFGNADVCSSSPLAAKCQPHSAGKILDSDEEDEGFPKIDQLHSSRTKHRVEFSRFKAQTRHRFRSTELPASRRTTNVVTRQDKNTEADAAEEKQFSLLGDSGSVSAVAARPPPPRAAAPAPAPAARPAAAKPRGRAKAKAKSKVRFRIG